MIVSIEQHVDWIAECIAHTRQRKSRVVEATRQAEEEWVMEVNQVAEQGLGGIIFTHPTCSSWYLGANIPGKPRVFMPYGRQIRIEIHKVFRTDSTGAQVRRGSWKVQRHYGWCDQDRVPRVRLQLKLFQETNCSKLCKSQRS